MELEAEDGAARIPIEVDSKTDVGRGYGFSTADRTVSRRHVSFQPPTGDDHEGKTRSDVETRVCFEVLGKNPILVARGSGGEKRIFRKSEVGDLGVGDRVSLSLKDPIFFSFKRRAGAGGSVEDSVLDAVQRREKRTLQRRREKEEDERKQMEIKSVPAERREEEGVDDAGLGLGLQATYLSQIDPVKEFGFLVRGQEFDRYPKQKVRSIRNWDWFLDETRESRGADEDLYELKRKREKGGERRKRKGEDNEDDEWTGESEDEKIVVAKAGSVKRRKYSIRSKDQKKESKSASAGGKPEQSKGGSARKQENEEEDEEDETLGGFIVDDEEEGEGQEGEGEGEEEDFEGDDDD